MYNKLVIIIPPSPWLISDTDLPFLGPLYVSSFLKRYGYSVKVCDLSGIKEKNWVIPYGDIYAVGGTSPNFPQIKKIVAKLKAREADKLVIVGGVHATVLPYHVLKNTKADVCIVGEAELPMLQIMDKGLTQDVEGIIYRQKKAIKINSLKLPYKDIDFFGFPDYEAIDYYKYAKSKTFKYLLGDCLEGTVITARGCPFSCAFCASTRMWNRQVRYHSVKHVVDEVKFLKETYGVELIYFVDDTFVLNIARVLDLCKELKKLDIKWHCLNRVDRVYEDVLQAMKESGCIGVVYGFESGDNAILKKMGKATTVELAYRAIELTKKAGLKIRGQLIVGFPGETEESVEHTAEFIHNAEEVDTFGVHVFQPVPGSAVWKEPEKFGYKVNKTNPDFSKFHTIGKSGEKLTDNKQVMKWYNYLKEVVKDRNIELQGASDD